MSECHYLILLSDKASDLMEEAVASLNEQPEYADSQAKCNIEASRHLPYVLSQKYFGDDDDILEIITASETDRVKVTSFPFDMQKQWHRISCSSELVFVSIMERFCALAREDRAQVQAVPPPYGLVD